jgi:hypothetical protein
MAEDLQKYRMDFQKPGGLGTVQTPRGHRSRNRKYRQPDKVREDSLQFEPLVYVYGMRFSGDCNGMS